MGQYGVYELNLRLLKASKLSFHGLPPLFLWSMETKSCRVNLPSIEVQSPLMSSYRRRRCLAYVARSIALVSLLTPSDSFAASIRGVGWAQRPSRKSEKDNSQTVAPKVNVRFHLSVIFAFPFSINSLVSCQSARISILKFKKMTPPIVENTSIHLVMGESGLNFMVIGDYFKRASYITWVDDGIVEMTKLVARGFFHRTC